MTRYAFEDWTAEQLRCTVFTLPGPSQGAVHWWQKLVGGDAEQVMSNPRLGTSQASGGFESGTLIVSAQPGRVDWFLSPSSPESASIQAQVAPELTSPSLGPASGALDVFSRISRQWLEFDDIPSMNRLALGGVFTHLEDDKGAAYLRLPDYVPVTVAPDSSDFLYQINLPSQSRLNINGLGINRFSRWSVGMFKLISLNLPGGNYTQDFGTAITLRAEIDVNTAPDFEGELPRARLVEILNELVENGRNLIENGVAQ